MFTSFDLNLFTSISDGGIVFEIIRIRYQTITNSTLLPAFEAHAMNFQEELLCRADALDLGLLQKN